MGEKSKPDTSMFARVLGSFRVLRPVREDGRDAVVRTKRRARLPTAFSGSNPSDASGGEWRERHPLSMSGATTPDWWLSVAAEPRRRATPDRRGSSYVFEIEPDLSPACRSELNRGLTAPRNVNSEESTKRPTFDRPTRHESRTRNRSGAHPRCALLDDDGS